MAYNGSVELIGGLIQKNSGNFALVDASAVRVDDETRLDVALAGKADAANTYTKAEVDALWDYVRDMSPVAEASGAVVTVDDAAPLDAERVVVNIEPVQSGSGDPSPDNVRPISGWTGANITVNGSVVNIVFPVSAGTVYGGTLDVTNGVLTVDRAMVTYDGSLTEQWIVGVYTGGVNRAYISVSNISTSVADNVVGDIVSNRFKAIAYSSVPENNNGISMRSGIAQINVFQTSYSTSAAWREFLASNNLIVVYPLATPITYQLTPQAITLLSGDNTIFADCGDVTLTYRQNVKILLDKLTSQITALNAAVANS